MKINTKIRYGLRMLVLLAEAKQVVNTAELGEKMKVSPKYLRKLAGPLEHHQLIRSVQGIYGGYAIGRDPKDITLALIFEAFDESINITGCTSKEGCPLNEECLTRPVWEHLENLISKEFHNITIRKIVENTFEK
ncbi:MAG: Rrf2 family transcriptional regulator [Candidatus Aminicenantes bacterium]|nr:MAG: Rrf2 family transcriptional regulator [Candidatus Aminicenantes bacterium]